MATTPAIDVLVGAVLFTDLVGFTEYTDTEGDAAAFGVLEQQTTMVSGLLDGCADARVVKELGDGLMLWFGAPRDAVERATALMTVVEGARDAGEFPLAVRMGLHHGEMLPRGEDLVGITVNIAARIAELAGPGELLASEVALDACGDWTPPGRLEPVGPAPVKGVAEPIWLVRVSAGS